MPKKLSKALTPLQVKNAKSGRHADGDGLHLLVKKTGARSWVYRFMLDGKSRDVGLSRCPEAIELLQKTGREELSLAQARDVAAIYRMKVKIGIDPLAQRQEAAAAAAAEKQAKKAASVTFRAAAESYIETNQDSWRNSKHRQQWKNTLETYVYPTIGDLPVADITTPHALAVLEPIWKEKPETASRVRGRIEVILDAAKVRGYREGENPARWRGHLAQILPARPKLSRGHHKAAPYSAVQSILQELQSRKAVAALALEFLILTAARTGEVIGATWAEFDLATAVWTVPADRMKAGREHRVPLSARTLEILQQVKKLGTASVFPGSKGGQMSGMAMAMLLRRMKSDVTVHGFRSSFRDWTAECTAYPHEVCEMALAHTVANKVEAAYRRGDLFEKRRRLMEDWAGFCAGDSSTAANVVPIRVGEQHA
ncbi:tyrosine-type recombinase/integrase [Planktotalea arctica]|uniref:tyrosine-type recombinase/integrase n=1 Tax=Planktotalea arctica TaxID=1481893 RepID=UPI000A16CCDE|nr:site-specific integrase [Planktotalea arctica]